MKKILLLQKTTTLPAASVLLAQLSWLFRAGGGRLLQASQEEATKAAQAIASITPAMAGCSMRSHDAITCYGTMHMRPHASIF